MIIRNAQVPRQRNSSPGWGTVDTARIGDAGGLTQFGVSVQTLEPGAKTSVRHWHESVDEFMYVLAGEVTVTEDDGPHVLHPGDAACWPAGVPNGHTLANRSTASCVVLLVGTRREPDVAHYVADADVPAEG